MSLEALHLVYGRLADGEPIRILIGEKFYSASEIKPLPTFERRLRRMLLNDLGRQIFELQSPEPPPTPVAPAMPIPSEGAA